MPYEIPQNLKYREKIAFGLTFNQMVWLSLFGGTAAVIFLKTGLDFYLKSFLGLVLSSFGAGFAFFGFSNHVKSLKTYYDSIRLAGYFDSRMKKFVEVKKVEDNAVFLKNGSLRAIVQVFPINFSMLSSQEQEAIIGAYKEFLNSLDFPIQIVMRTVNLSLDGYMSGLEEKAKKQGSEKLLEQFNSFREFTKQFIEANAVKNRLFYIVIPYSPSAGTTPLTDLLVFLQNIFSKQKQKTSHEINKENALNHLEIRTKLCIQKLKKCNLLSKRLETNELTSLLASFFEGFVEAQNNYFFPVTMLEEFEKTQEERKYVGLQGQTISVKNAEAMA